MDINIYTKSGCIHCNWAKTLLHSKGIGFNEHKLNEHFTREFIVENFPSAKTFPVIIIDGFDVNGFEGLKSYLKTAEAGHHNAQFLIE